MPETLLRTKLFVPPLLPNLVSRPHLLERLGQGLEPGRKIILISAPPGFGKTTLLSQWIATLDHPVGWLSLDEADNDPDQFLTYLMAALEPIAPEVVNLLQPSEASQPLPMRAALAELIHELAETQEPLCLILDDLHLIDNPRIHYDLLFAVQHLPPQMHLILSSRTDPPWPLARMRARRELIELRTADLRFATEEASAFLNDIMALELSAADIAVLGDRTEGWITGLQLASLSMRGKENRPGFVTAFSGSHRFILDYLMEEVLQRQPPATQEFLLKTSILTRLNGPLCDAVLAIDGSQTILTQLEQENLFLIPLDDERYWFRYHHLFADLLQKELEQNSVGVLPELHYRASYWLEAAGQANEAIHHALAGKDFDHAARLIEGQVSENMKHMRTERLSRWLNALPQETILQRPLLAVSQAFALEFDRRADVEQTLQSAEAALARELPAGSQPAKKRHLTGIIAMIRAHNRLAYGDLQQTVAESHRARRLLPDDDPLQAEVGIILGCADWALGNRAAAEHAFETTAAVCLRLNQPFHAAAATCYVGTQQAKQGRLKAAYETYAEAQQLAARSGRQPLPIVCFPMARMGDLWREWNDLARARELLEEALAIAIDWGHADVLGETWALMARLRLALGDEAGLQLAIRQTRQVVAANPVDLWIGDWLDECQIRSWLSRGDLDVAVRWVEQSGLTDEGELSYHHDLHHTNQVRVLIAQGADAPGEPYLTQAGRLLDRLLVAAEQADWIHDVIGILVLKAVCAWTGSDNEAGTAALERALALAEPGGYMRLFLDEGRPVRELLQLTYHSSPSSYVVQLLAAMERREDPTATSRSSLSDPLSQRELEVLQLLDSQLSSTKIAEQLFISANTVRFHMKNIYDKLTVHSRAEAVEKARTLNLI